MAIETQLPKTLIAIATYNERENLPGLIDAIHQHAPHADVLVVDDNSPDGTGDWVDQHAAGHPWLGCLHRAGKLGLGSASYDAFRHAIEHGYEVVATLDADWSHPPDRLPALLEAVHQADVAIGSRYCPGGAIEGWPLRRRVTSWVLNAVASRALRLPVGDCSGAFRAYRVEKLREVDFDNVLTLGYAYLEELLWRLRRRGATFAERPITFRDRVAGASKINLREAAAALRVIAVLGWREWTGLGRSQRLAGGDFLVRGRPNWRGGAHRQPTLALPIIRVVRSLRPASSGHPSGRRFHRIPPEKGHQT